jgi:hypothetical protein
MKAGVVLSITAWRLCIVAALLPTANARAQAGEENPCVDRTVAVNVLTRGGLVGEGLNAANFRGKYRGKTVEIASATRHEGASRILILLDTSGSMVREGTKWQAGIAMVRNLTREAPAGTSFALLTFAARVEERVEFGLPPWALHEVIEKLAARDWEHYKGPPRRTALFDSIVAALDLLRPPRPGDAIFLVTDGGENASHSREDQVIRALLESGARLFVFLTLTSRERRGSFAEVEAPEKVLHLAQATGGACVPYPFSEWDGPAILNEVEAEMRANDPKAIPTMAGVLIREMSEFYSLQIKLPQPVDKVRNWKLEAVSPGSKKNPYVGAIYPHMLAPCQ